MSQEVVDSENNTELHKALIQGDLAKAHTLLDNGASVTHVNKKLQTALHLAVLYGNEALVEKMSCQGC